MASADRLQSKADTRLTLPLQFKLTFCQGGLKRKGVSQDHNISRMLLALQEGGSRPYRTTTDEADGFYRTAKDPLEVDEEGIEMSSAPVAFGHPASRHGKDVVRRTESDDPEQGLPPGAHLIPHSIIAPASGLA